MQKTVTLVYTILSASVAGFMTIMQITPTTYLMDLFSTDGGSKYYVAPVFLITWLALLLPLLLIILILKVVRRPADDVIPQGKTGIIIHRVKAFQSAMVGIPIIINDEKAGVIDNGKTRFFELRPGRFTLQAGKGKPVSMLIDSSVSEGQQQKFQLQLVPDGLKLKYELTAL